MESFEQKPKKRTNSPWWHLLLVAIVILGAYFRFVGLQWDDSYHLHPDERFLAMVESGISPVKNISEYFNTDISSLNPQNRGYGFFVYGTLPIFLVRYAAEMTGQTGYDQVTILGRMASGLFDVGTICLVYLIALKLFKKTHIALIASAFYAFAVLPIQLSHYFTVDNFSTFFGMLTFYLAVVIQDFYLPTDAVESGAGSGIDGMEADSAKMIPWRYFALFALFGIALGMAAASKINAILLAVTLPIATLLSLALATKNDWHRNFWSKIVPGWILAAIVALLTFRVLQPYAFAGTTFFSFKLNPKWIDNLKELSNLSSAITGFPPSVQWAARPIWFGWENMVKWGLGLPLGLFAWLGMIVLIIVKKGKESNRFWLIALWTLFYFSIQEIQYTSSMRYMMLVYPTLVIIAAYFFDWIWQKAKTISGNKKNLGKIIKAGSVVITGLVLIGTFLWAFAFTRIYTRLVTRIEASYWIYQNVPGPINLQIQNGDSVTNQPISYPLGMAVAYDKPVSLKFIAGSSVNATGMEFSYIRDQLLINPGNSKTLIVKLIDENSGAVATGILMDPFTGGGDPRGSNYSVLFDQPLALVSGHTYQLVYSLQELDETLFIMGPQDLTTERDGIIGKMALPEPENLIHTGEFYETSFTPIQSGTLSRIQLNRVVDWEQNTGKKTIEISLIQVSQNGSEQLGKGIIESSFAVRKDPRGEGYWVDLEQPVQLDESKNYSLSIRFLEGQGAIAIYGSRQANESTWDDALPYSVYGSNPFDYYNGVYRTDLNFEMYWDDNTSKLQRFETVLDQTDYIFISSNRQWGSITRLPDYYPLTSKYYRELMGCPEGKEITWCYSVATPGMFKGDLGFELVQTFQSDPNIGKIKFNTQFAEEAFTVYDHPKVLIFKKTDSHDSASVQKILGSIDLTNVPSISNYQNSGNNLKSTNLMLPADRLEAQQAGGTWSEIFNTSSLINKYPGLGIIVWYLAISLLGWIVFPTVRIVFHGLKDRGYPFGRLFGLLVLACITWILGSYKVPLIRVSILAVLSAIVLVNVILAVIYREDLHKDLVKIKKSIWQTELVSLVFFAFFALIRLGNPDLWHPYKGGEKPMDFSYFNAVLKSTSFPPYDPWYAGGYINYYYYGYVIVGVPVKLLGIVPSIAYNFILPTLFSLVGLGAYSIGWNLTDKWNSQEYSATQSDPEKMKRHFPAWLGGLIAAIILLILGNLGTVRMIWNGFQKLAANGAVVEQGKFFQRWIWTFQGIAKFLKGNAFPYAPGDWYWIPSRAIPGDAITEFPFFTFLYADLHAHMIALPITICAIGWSLSILFRKWEWSNSKSRLGWLAFLITFIGGGLIVGALKPTNTWDIYTFLPFALITIVYTLFKYFDVRKTPWIKIKPIFIKLILTVLSCVFLIAIASLLYRPFSEWYKQGYNAVEFWRGDKTPIWSYITHWGLFLFIILSWLIISIRDWMKTTPASALKKLQPYKELIWAGGLIAIIVIIVLLILKIEIAWFTIPLILMTLLLIFRRDQSDLHRFVLFMIATGLTLTMVVELVVLKGDIGRMNTVFKIYLQAWSLLALGSAFALIDLGKKIILAKKSGWVTAWKTCFVLLIFSAILFPIMAGADKIRDRISSTNALTLDGSRFMLTSTYSENNTTMNLAEDFYAIQWMQQNVIGSPVIVEGNVPEYRWGTRYTIYTGLPGVVGWNWHQRQQRGVVSAEAVQKRVDEVGLFYQTEDIPSAEKFIRDYNVRYIIVGQLERAIYPAAGIAKFEQMNGILWHVVYSQGNTVIYQVGGSS